MEFVYSIASNCPIQKYGINLIVIGIGINHVMALMAFAVNNKS